MTNLSETVQLKGSPIQRRMQRIEEFKRFVVSNRESKKVKTLIALFSLESGLRKKVVLEYLRLLLDGGFYKEWRGKLLTPKEYDQAIKEWQKEREKEEEARRLRREKMQAEVFLGEEFKPPEIEADEVEV